MMRKKNIGTGIKKYLPLLMGMAFACLLVFFSYSFKAKIIASNPSLKITSFEKDLNKNANLTQVNIRGSIISIPGAKQSKFRKKFQMGGDSYIEFKAAETFAYKLPRFFRKLTINYHTPNVITAVVLFLHRLTSF